MIRICLTATLLALASAAASAATLLETAGPFYQRSGLGRGNGQQAGAIGFSTTFPLEDVSFHVPLSNASFSAVHSITAYLTNQIGPGTTAANLLAQNTFTINPGQEAEFNALSVADLEPGTYYLMLIDFDFNEVGWGFIWNNNLSVNAGPGMSLVSSLGYAQESGSFPPAFEPNGDTRGASIFGGAYRVRIEGTAIVPEPSSIVLICGTLAAVAAWCRRVAPAAATVS
jgi:hypothetical protein